ncbi:MAG: hypothetical protein NVS3B3_06040 [Aquirhabdus sp.]
MNEKMADSFPLCWPAGYPRAKNRNRARFKSSFENSRKGIFRELKNMGVPDWNVILSTNIPLRRDGMPYSTPGRISDPGVAVYFKMKDKPMVLACDQWEKIEDNMHAIELSISAMRGLDRWGCSDILDRAFTGFIALPAPSAKREWWDILQCSRDSSQETILAQYRRLAKDRHPDRMGSHEMMTELNEAFARSKK